MTAAEAIRDRAAMVRPMRPERVPGRWVFRAVDVADLPALSETA